MTYIVLGYGVHFEESEDFVKQHSELIESIREQDRKKDWKDKIIVGIGGSNWDLSFLIGVGFDTIEYTATSLVELNETCLKEDYKARFEERLEKYPELKEALKPYEKHIGFQIILDRE